VTLAVLLSLGYAIWQEHGSRSMKSQRGMPRPAAVLLKSAGPAPNP
jgi:hypothetical protein